MVKEAATAFRAGSHLPRGRFRRRISSAGGDDSGHLNFWAHLYPAVMVTDTSFYRKPRYDTATTALDTPTTSGWRSW